MTDNVSGNARVDERFRAGERRFSRLERRIDASDEAVREHLQRQDEKIDSIVASVSKIQTNAQSMIDTWEGGARVVRALCRLACRRLRPLRRRRSLARRCNEARRAEARQRHAVDAVRVPGLRHATHRLSRGWPAQQSAHVAVERQHG